jgi:outer membrane immunogenic protein
MRKLLISGVGVLSTFIVMGQAMADEAPPKRERAAAPVRAAPQRAAPQQQASNWSGGQAGGSNGVSSANNNFVEPGAYNFSSFSSSACSGCAPYETPFSFSGSAVSYIVGGFLGYRVQMGNIVVGVEGDVYWKRGETSKVQNAPPPWLTSETFTGSQKQGTDGSVRARIGYLVTPWTLLYATGGLAIGSISGSFSYSALPPICSSSPCSSFSVTGAASWSDTRVGGTIGAGAETQVFAGVKARVEYRYTDFGSFSKDVPLTNNSFGACGTPCGTNAHIDLRAYNHRLTVGVGFDLDRLGKSPLAQ